MDEQPAPDALPAGGRERWTFEWWVADGSLAVVQELTFRPGGTSFHVAVTGVGRRPVVLADDEVNRPRDPRYLELRSEGVWAHHVCEAPHERWTLGLEAFAVVHDGPADGLGSGWGERVGVAVDLDWEAVAAPVATGDGYHQFGEAHGEVLVGSESFDRSFLAHRSHRRGPESGELGVWAVLDGRCGVGGYEPSAWSAEAPPTGGAVVDHALGTAVAVEPMALATWRSRSGAVATGLVTVVDERGAGGRGVATWRSGPLDGGGDGPTPGPTRPRGGGPRG